MLLLVCHVQRSSLFGSFPAHKYYLMNRMQLSRFPIVYQYIPVYSIIILYIVTEFIACKQISIHNAVTRIDMHAESVHLATE